MEFKVHGSRGSIPISSSAAVKYGGNTSCYELVVGNFQIILDTGSGFRNLKLKPDKQKLILYSHWHHDHIQGLPFNSDIFVADNHMQICCALTTSRSSRNRLRSYFSGGYFPIDIINMLPNIKFMNFNEVKKCLTPTIKLEFINLDHPGGSAGYAITTKEKKLVYLCDNEFHKDRLEELSDFVEGADLVVWDGMYTEKELENKKGWGHSSIEQAQYFYKMTKIKKLMITHHEPSRTDTFLDKISNSLPEGIFLSRDGYTIEL